MLLAEQNNTYLCTVKPTIKTQIMIIYVFFLLMLFALMLNVIEKVHAVYNKEGRDLHVEGDSVMVSREH